ncbi:MAG TPA: single-stranded DNA-binding protein [Alphaproteobacteria bacterium]|nr:single-stranded DNA-binding protein [Alphaproteobacteria bacterium]
MSGGSLNKVMIIGNLGKEPEIRATHDGREVANLVIATNESWTDKNTGERKEKTEWHKVACFNPGLISVIKNYVKKGSKLFIEGQLQTRKWQDQAGQERYSTEIVLQGYNCNLTMLDRAGSSGGGYSRGDDHSGGSSSGGYNAPKQQARNDDGFNNSDIDDDIPF